jgi:SAM-dependent methyltransferase
MTLPTQARLADERRVLAIGDWFANLFACALPEQGRTVEHDGRTLSFRDGIVRVARSASVAQTQTSSAFGYKWQRRETYESPSFAAQTRAWLIERYGDPETFAWLYDGDRPRVLFDAGCGSGFTALALFGDALRRVHYVGADISEAIDVAAQRFAECGMPGRFMQSNLMDLPLREESVDAIYSEGVLHHTDSTRDAILRLARLLRRDGRMMFYVYRRKGPIREFTDDLVRERLQQLSPEEAWQALVPLTRLGKALGELKLEIHIPETVDLLAIPAGKIDVQRLFYWHVCKAFYRPEMTIDEMNHINFDWFAPRNSHRQSPEEVRAWCAEAGLVVERERIEEAGITIVARRAN